MARISLKQSSFNGGEWAPLLYGRTDVEKYASALDTCFNAITLVQGPWTRRPGTGFQHQERDHGVSSVLVPFRHSSGNNYILEFADAVMRVYINNGLTVNTAVAVTSVSSTNPMTVTATTHGFTNGTRVLFYDVVGMHQINGSEFVVTNANTNDFTLLDTDNNAVNGSAYSVFTSGNVADIFELATPYTAGNLSALRWTQSADALYLFHRSYEPRILTRQAANAWTLSDFTATDGPYLDVNTTSTTISPSAATGAVTLVASAVTGINDDTGFQSTDVGRLIRLQEGATWGYAEITTVVNTQTVSATALSTLTNTNAKTNWRLGVWSNTTGWPNCGSFAEDRLWVGGTTDFPNRVDASKSGAYTNFSPSGTDGTVADDNSISYPLNASDLHETVWIAGVAKGVAIGTTRGEWLLTAGSTTAEAITPSNATASPSTYHGGAAMQPAQIGNAILFAQRGARKLREFAYLFEQDGFNAPDMTLFSEHIMRPSVTGMGIQNLPQTIVWSVRSDGELLGFTYERDQNVTAWHRHTLGGYSEASLTTAAKVESIALVPSADGTRDELWMGVKRYVNGGVKRYIEYMTKFWETDDDQEDAVYLDSAWTQINTAGTTSVTNLIHLEGQTVSIYADGAEHPRQAVANGLITLNRTSYIVTVGFPYTSDGLTMPPEGGSQDGTGIGKIKKVSRVGFWLLDTLGMKYGRDGDNLTEVLIGEWGDNYGEATPLFTGLVRKRFEGTYDRLGQVYWRCEGPFPATVMAVLKTLDVSDDS